MIAEALPDNYSINQELEYLRNSGFAIVWNYGDRHKTMYSNSTLFKNQGENPYNLNSFHITSIQKFKNLNDNWDEDGAIAPSLKTINDAVSIARHLNLVGQKIYHTSPGPNGEILISLRKNDKDVELLIYSDKLSRIVTISDKEKPSQKELNTSNLQVTLSWLNS
jgi:hypothetical protein